MDPEATASAEGEPAPKKPKRLRRVLQAGTVVLDNKDLLIQALELLRKSQTVTPQQEAELVAAFDQGTARVRDRVIALVNNLQQANFGQAVVTLRTEREALRKDATEAATAFKKEGRVLLEEARGELQSFLDRNRPTVEAVERASEGLAGAARELAASLKFAGREAADELLRRGRTALTGTDTAALEQAAFDWGARTVPRMGRLVTRVLLGLALLLALAGLLVGATAFPGAATVVAIAFLAVALILAAYVAASALKLQRLVTSQARELERWAAMESSERRRLLAGRFRRRSEADETPDLGGGSAGEDPSEGLAAKLASVRRAPPRSD